jgi:hypothetical protein
LIANVINMSHMGDAAMRQTIEYAAEQIEAAARLFAATDAAHEGRQ